MTRIIGLMLLALDFGNSRLKVGLFEGGVLLRRRSATTPQGVTADELELLLDGLLRLDGTRLDEVRDVSLASVVPATGEALAALAARRSWSLLTLDATTVPIPVRVDRPAQVGADRLANAVAVHRLYGAPAIVVDLGTATTFDAVAADGAYVGGAIAAGIELGLGALASRSALLPWVEPCRPERAIGRDTATALQSGAVLGHLGLIGELVKRIGAELGADAGVGPVLTVLTGGLSAAPWLAELQGVHATDPDLTLRGLAIAYAQTRPDRPQPPPQASFSVHAARRSERPGLGSP